MLLVVSLNASPAAAVSSIDLVWNLPGLPTIRDYSPSSIATALVILRGDPNDGGVHSIGLAITFDTVELDFVSLHENSGVATEFLPTGKGNQFEPLDSLNTVVNEAAGLVTGFDSVTIGNGCFSCTITLGSIRFHLVSSTSGPNDLDAKMAITSGIEGVFANPGPTLLIPNFGSVENGLVPEPGTAAMLGLGLLSLAWSSRGRAR